MQSVTPVCTHTGLGSSHFARRYFGNRVFFLFLRLLRCFSSPGSLPYVMDWRMDDWSSSSRVSPFRHLRINEYLLLPVAFRSLSRLSSALSAKASTLRPFLLNLRSAAPSCGLVLKMHSPSWRFIKVPAFIRSAREQMHDAFASHDFSCALLLSQ